MTTQQTPAPPAAQSAFDLIKRYYGLGRFQPFVNRDATQAGTSAGVAARNDPNRVSLTIVNLGSTNVFVAPQSAPTTTKGILLGALGGSLSLNWRDDLVLPTFEWQAIADTSADDLYILELVLF